MSEQILNNYINGKWVPSKSGKFRDVLNPATAEVLSKVPVSTSNELDEAVQAAHKTFQDPTPYPVSLSPGLTELQSRVAQQIRHRELGES